MSRIPIICISALMMVLFPARGAYAETPLVSQSLNGLEQRLAEIDAELAELAHYSLRSGIGSIGYRSLPHKTPEQPEWVEIELEKETPITEIMLVPTIRRDSEDGFQADGFPAAFRITVGTDNDRTGSLLGEYHSADGILPRIAPFVIPTEGTVASWIRIEATRLSARAFDNNYVFQLAEVLVLAAGKTWHCAGRSTSRQVTLNAATAPGICAFW